MAKPKILVFQHVPYEPLGTLDPLLKAAGFRIRYVNFARKPDAEVELDRYAALIVLGGPMSAEDTANYPNLGREIDYLKRAADSDMSVLGICLGAQLLARALGGRVHRQAAPEIGWHDVVLSDHGRSDAVLSSFTSREAVFQWHEDAIELPSGIEPLASSEDCDVQAFTAGEHVYGFQFHLEVNEPLVQRWLRVPDNRRMLGKYAARVRPEAVVDETRRRIAGLEALSERTFSRWIERFELPPRKLQLPSR
jgi:GMP synthase (glutamine-hydrolysing)